MVRKGRGSHAGVDLKDLDALGDGEEVFEPSAVSTETGGNPFEAVGALDKRLLYSIVGAILLVTVFGLYVVLRPRAADDASNQPPPPPVSYPLAPPPKPVQAPKVVIQPPKPVPVAHKAATRPVIHPAWFGVRPVLAKVHPDAINDKMVEDSIKKAVVFLKGQFQDGALTDSNNNSESHAGGDALAVYALLHAGQAIDDPDLNSSSRFVGHILDHVKEYPMDKGKPIYERSIRTAALSMYDREADRDQLARDREWLLKAMVDGAYGYEMPPPKATIKTFSTDNSTSQFGVLGIWAAEAAGQPIPDKYWPEVEQHWLSCQAPNGGWMYTANGTTPTMTAAGVTTLCVAAEFETEDETIKSRGSAARPAFSRAVDRGLDYLDKGDTILGLGGRGYSLYTLERAALATGFRWFGKHDWYRELGARAIKEQSEDGSWSDEDGRDVATSFTLLFMSRGRQPLLMDKLRFAGDWDDRPRDVSRLAAFTSAQLEKPFAWGVADLNRDWWDWLESPVLFISTDTPPTFSDQDCDKLRSYVQGGGLIFIHNEYGSKEVNAFVVDLAKRLFPAYPMTRMAPGNLFYNDVFPIKNKPVMESVSNGTRTLLIYSPKDITEEWVRYRPRDNKDNPDLQAGLNLFVDGAGKSDFRNRLNTPYVGPPEDKPLATVPVYQISYPGPWNPEPGAWLRFPRWFQKQTSLALDIRPTDIRGVISHDVPIALLTGNAYCDFSSLDTHALREYVNHGGVLFIDSTGGNKAFTKAVRDVLLPLTFPGVRPIGMPRNAPILAGDGPCMDPLPRPRLRNYAASLLNGVAPGIEYANYGKGTIIISDLDVTTGLLDSGTYGIYGYSPEYCQSLLKNVILWTLSRYHV